MHRAQHTWERELPRGRALNDADSIYELLHILCVERQLLAKQDTDQFLQGMEVVPKRFSRGNRPLARDLVYVLHLQGDSLNNYRNLLNLRQLQYRPTGRVLAHVDSENCSLR